jgi:hypothetical protein
MSVPAELQELVIASEGLNKQPSPLPDIEVDAFTRLYPLQEVFRCSQRARRLHRVPHDIPQHRCPPSRRRRATRRVLSTHAPDAHQIDVVCSALSRLLRSEAGEGRCSSWGAGCLHDLGACTAPHPHARRRRLLPGSELLPYAASYGPASLSSPHARLRRLGCEQLGRLLALGDRGIASAAQWAASFSAPPGSAGSGDVVHSIAYHLAAALADPDTGKCMGSSCMPRAAVSGALGRPAWWRGPPGPGQRLAQQRGVGSAATGAQGGVSAK